jgi:hypothetical protein
MSSFTKLGVFPGRVVLVGDGGSDLARALRACGQEVTELPPSDFQGGTREMADVVAVLPDCDAPERVGAVAAACARCVWFQDRKAPKALASLLRAAGVPLVEGHDLAEECGA